MPIFGQKSFLEAKMKRLCFFLLAAAMVISSAICLANTSRADAKTGQNSIGSGIQDIFKAGSGNSLAGQSLLGGGVIAPVTNMDGFPPFFGDNNEQNPSQQQPAPQQQPSPQPSPQPFPQGQQQPQQNIPGDNTQALLGGWLASNGTDTMFWIFMPNAMCGLGYNGQQLMGNYLVQGNQLQVRFTNGKSKLYTFAIQGNQLRLDENGSSMIFVRQQLNLPGQPQPNFNPQQPQPNFNPQQPQQQPMPGATVLEGKWVAFLPNQARIEMIFQGNQYICNVNGTQSETGMFTLSGDRLEYTVTSGQSVGKKGVNTWRIYGNYMVMTFSNNMSIRYLRQQ